jgi:hypothetical protein
MPLDFAAKRDSGSKSWTRADPTAALIERVAWNRWLVMLPDGDDAHEVQLERDHGAYVGDCEVRETGEQCPGRKYNDESEPCAHLCTIRKAAFVGIEDQAGEPVQIFDRDDVELAKADPHIESAMADGGREVNR